MFYLKRLVQLSPSYRNAVFFILTENKLSWRAVYKFTGLQVRIPVSDFGRVFTGFNIVSDFEFRVSDCHGAAAASRERHAV